MDTRIVNAITAIIENFAVNTFSENGATMEEAAIITEAVAARFRKRAYDDLIMSLVQFPEPTVRIHEEEPVYKKAEEPISPEDLKKALDKAVIAKDCAAK